MYTPILDRLKDRFQYEAWRGRNTLDENLFIWKFFFFGDELPGWSPVRVENLEAPGAPRMIQSMWQLSQSESALAHNGPSEALLNVRSFECPSRESAHELLLRFLGEFQGPLFDRRDQSGLGDVTFAVPGDALILFARANLVHLVRNAERQQEPVTGVSMEFDRELTRKPETSELPETDTVSAAALTESPLAPRIRRLEAPVESVRVGESVALDLEASDPLDEVERVGSRLLTMAALPLSPRLQYKIFSQAGQVHDRDGKLFYTAQEPGPQEVAVYAINAARKATRKGLQLFAT